MGGWRDRSRRRAEATCLGAATHITGWDSQVATACDCSGQPCNIRGTVHNNCQTFIATNSAKTFWNYFACRWMRRNTFSTFVLINFWLTGVPHTLILWNSRILLLTCADLDTSVFQINWPRHITENSYLRTCVGIFQFNRFLDLLVTKLAGIGTQFVKCKMLQIIPLSDGYCWLTAILSGPCQWERRSFYCWIMPLLFLLLWYAWASKNPLLCPVLHFGLLRHEI